MRLLLIEDDDRTARPLAEGLGRFGFTVDRARTDAVALSVPDADLVLLGLRLPDMGGLDVCRAMRSRSDVPIIMITGRDEETDRVAGLELGADDYLSKPFGVRELVARIRAVLRRTRRAASGVARATQHLGPLSVDRRTRRVEVDGVPVNVAPKEFDLLACLAQEPGAVCPRQQILDTVWGPRFADPAGLTSPIVTLDVHVAALRRKLGHPGWIETVSGVGFRFAVPDCRTMPPTLARTEGEGTA